MNINKTFKSQFLKAADLDDEEKIVTISGLSLEEVGQDKEEKPVLWFQEYEVGLVLNKTNASTVATMYGNETDEWTGKRIALFPTMVDFGGKSVEAIRIKGRPPKAAAVAAPQRPQGAPAATGRPGAGAPTKRDALKPLPQQDPDEWNDEDPIF